MRKIKLESIEMQRITVNETVNETFCKELEQESENYDLWAKSTPALVFVNKVVLRYNQVHPFIYCLWLFSVNNGTDE